MGSHRNVKVVVVQKRSRHQLLKAKGSAEEERRLGYCRLRWTLKRRVRRR